MPLLLYSIFKRSSGSTISGTIQKNAYLPKGDLSDFSSKITINPDSETMGY
jgi:hypothetical protein